MFQIRPLRRIGSLLPLAALCLSAQAPSAASRVKWPKPAGWSAESLPFPLDFAPELAHQGSEELRFMPGFFDPAAPDNWSYVFVWCLDSPAPAGQVQLEPELKAYFKGLCLKVGKKFNLNPARFRCNLVAVKVPEGQWWSQAYLGSASIYDCFKTGKAITLNLKARIARGRGGQYLLVEASPKPLDAEVWKSLDACANSFGVSGR